MRRTRARISGIGAITAVMLEACSQENRYVAPPPPKVTVAVPVQKPITRYLELTGSVAAVNSADLVARVPGFVQGINYQDGALVNKGTSLFIIEPEP
jgi:multidrug efflux pump subunit AcrA (membrane-fusion protein)